MSTSLTPKKSSRRGLVAALIVAPALLTSLPALAQGDCNFRPANYGAMPNDGLNDSSGIQAAINAAQTSGGTVCLEPGEYRLNTQLTITTGAGFLPIVLRGSPGGTFLRTIDPTGKTTAIQVQGSHSFAERGSGACIGHFELRDLTIQPLWGTTIADGVAGLKIGKPGTWMDGFTKSLVSGILVYDFAIGFSVENARQIHFERVVARTNSSTSPKGLLVQNTEGTFTGDLVFVGSEFSTGNKGNAVKIYGWAPSSAADYSEVRGLHFSDCNFYNGEKAVWLLASTYAKVEDVWFNSCAADGPGGGKDAFVIQTDMPSARIAGVQLVNPYVVNYSRHGVDFAREPSGEIVNCAINGGYFGMLGGIQGIRVFWARHINIRNVGFFDLGAQGLNSSVIRLIGGSANAVLGCTYDDSTPVDHLVGSNGSDNFMIVNNVGRCATGTAVEQLFDGDGVSSPNTCFQ